MSTEELRRLHSEMRQRTELVGLRLTPEEHGLAESRAAAAGVTVQEMVRRLLAAPTSPSEPVPSTPRVFAMPEIPEDVKTLRDGRDGHSWVRANYANDPSDPTEYWTDGDALISLGHLLQSRAPLTEVEETNDGD